jgi:hypothetical protein
VKSSVEYRHRVRTFFVTSVLLTCQCVRRWVYGLRAETPVIVYSNRFFLQKWPFLLAGCALADVAYSLQA